MHKTDDREPNLYCAIITASALSILQLISVSLRYRASLTSDVLLWEYMRQTNDEEVSRSVLADMSPMLTNMLRKELVSSFSIMVNGFTLPLLEKSKLCQCLKKCIIRIITSISEFCLMGQLA